MKEVDRVCDEIMKKEERVDLLWLSCGMVWKLGARDGMLALCFQSYFIVVVTRGHFS